MRFINATNNKQLGKNLRAISLMDELKFHRILAFDRFGCITKKTLNLFPIRILNSYCVPCVIILREN